MNIDDVSGEIKVPENIISEIFAHQTELMNKYHVIEKKNGALIPDAPWHIDNHLVQYRIKDFFWRTTEEVCEALEVAEDIHSDWKSNWDTNANIRHFMEELSDALHFLVEASIYAGLDINKLEDISLMILKRDVYNSICNLESIKKECMNVIYHMGLAANALKCKMWKNTHMPTDKIIFDTQLEQVWENFFQLWHSLFCNLEDVYMLYFRKNRVNLFRIKTNY